MYDLTEAERNQIIGFFKGDNTKKHIIETLGFSKTTVLQTIQTFCEGKSLKTQSRSGRPKLLNYWSVRKWKSIIWSDESHFTIFKNDGPGRVWRTPGTRFNIKNMVPSIKHGGGGVMMWVVFQERD
ncbi:unnamed protein product [Rhizophagus irregularis]|nr:unnamed protein product [Rhizophagus irregularis]